MVKMGDIVYDVGDCFDSIVTSVTVNDRNIDLIHKFWNRLFFRTKEEAQRKNDIAHALYGEYQAMCNEQG